MSKNAIKYVPRKLYDKADIDIVTDGLKNRQNVLLLGPRGVGKTSLAEVVAENLGRELVTVPCHTGATAEELIGQWVPAEDGKGFHWMDGLVTNAVRHGKVLFLDEVNSLRPEVAFAIHGLLDHRRELVLLGKPGKDGSPEVIQASNGFGLIAAGNPFYEGVRTMNEAFRDRFAIQIRFGYVAELDQEVLSRSPLNAKLKSDDERSAVQVFIQKTRAAIKSKAIYSDISTRAFIDFQQNLVLHGFQVARTLFLSRFDDDAEVNAARTIFREVWDDRGNVQAAIAQAAKTEKKGRAGKFAAGADADTTNDAKSTF